MASTPLAAVVRQVRRLAVRPEAEPLSDQQLLHRYVVHREEAAFAALVHRHAPLVLGVGRRVLHDLHAAEDVLQATFLLLARKAASIRKRDAVGSWLHGVAYRVASRVRQRRAGRAAELPRQREAPSDPLTEVSWRELGAVLDEELTRLPETYRAPLLLCLMQGRTQDEAAAALGWSKGTLRRRFARGRELLRVRLAARGVSLAVGLTATVLAQPPSAAALAPDLLRSVLGAARQAPAGAAGTVSAEAAALAEEGVPALPAARPHLGAFGALALFVLAAGTGLLALPLSAARQAPPAQAKAAAAVDPPRPGDAGPPRDLFGDPLPEGALVRLGTVRFRQGNFVYGLLLSPDGKTVISYGGNQVITFWDPATGREVRRLKPGARLAVLTPDGGTLIAFGDYAIRFWEVATGKLLRTKEIGGWVTSLAVSPDGKLLAAGHPSERVADSGRVKVWDIAADRLVHTFVRKGHEPSAVAFSPDGKLLAAGYRHHGAIRFWDLATGKEARVLTGHPEGIRSLAFSPDGARLASGGALGDGSLRLWDLATGKSTALLTKIKGRVRTTAAGPGKDGRLSKARHEATLGEVRALAFSPDGKVLVSGGDGGDPGARVFDVATGKQLRQLGDRRNAVDGLAFARDGRAVYVGMGGSVRRFEVATGKELGPVGGHGQYISQVRLAPDGRVAVTAGGDRTIRFWDVRSGKELKRLEGHGGGVRCVALSPDGRLLASGGDDRTVRVWEVATGRQVRCLHGHDGDVYDIAFSPDGRLLASCDYFMGGLLLWDAATGELQKRLTEGMGLMCLAFAPDGRTLVAGEMAAKRARDMPRARIRFFDVATGKETRSVEGHDHWVHGLAFSPDGKLLASAGRDEQIRLWEPGTGKLLGQLGGYRWGTNCLAFTPDGRALAVGAFGQPLDLWEVTSRQVRQRILGHEAAVHSLVLTPDGRTLVSVSMDTTGLTWDVTGLRAGPRRPAAAPSPKELQAMWADLAADAKTAHRALWSLVAAGEQAVPWLRERLRPVPAVPARRIAELVADLDNARFKVRDRAARELEQLEDLAGAALRRALAAGPASGKSSEEHRRRVAALLKKLEEPLTSGERLRAVRAVEVLEQIATLAARQELQRLARGAPAARLTREAAAALRRAERANARP
jgi:RNA polymerase sigma factor (sigma-70 family)